MNTELRNVSGSSTKLLTAIIVSSLRESSAMALLSAPTPVPSSTEQTVSATMPAMPPGYSAPTIRPRTMMIDRLDDADHGALEQPPGDERPAARRAHEEPVDHAAVDVVDEAHAAPAR